jgi:hypothetical protein
MDEHEPKGPSGGAPFGYEDDAVPSGLVLRVVGGTIVVTTILCIVAFLLVELKVGELRPSRVFSERELGAPRTVAKVRASLFEAEAPGERTAPAPALLEGYRWVDRRGRKVAIPIERAMQIVAGQKNDGDAR